MSGRKRPRHDDRQPATPNAEFSRCLGLDLTVRINVTRARRRQGDMLGTASLQQHRCAEAELQMRDAGHELPDRAWRDEIEIELAVVDGRVIGDGKLDLYLVSPGPVW